MGTQTVIVKKIQKKRRLYLDIKGKLGKFARKCEIIFNQICGFGGETHSCVCCEPTVLHTFQVGQIIVEYNKM